MSHVNLFRTDYGHLLEAQVDEIDELTGIKSPADLSLYSAITVISKNPVGQLFIYQQQPVE